MTGAGARAAGGRFGAGVLALRGSEVLLARRAASEHEPLTWACFGGMAEEGESPRGCAVRELLEEAGLSVAEEDLVPAYVFHGDDGFEFHTFVARVPGDAVATPSVEAHAVGAFALGGPGLWDRLPSPLHTGMARLVADPAAGAVVAALLGA